MVKLYFIMNILDILSDKKKMTSKRSSIDNFLVMQILSNANEIEKKGRRVIHLELGEPLKKTPQPVLDEVKKNLNINLPDTLLRMVFRITKCYFKVLQTKGF